MLISHPKINMKCVVFAALAIALYFHRPSPCVTESKTTAALASYIIFFVAYVAMALYDEYHWNRGCKHAASVLLKAGQGPTSLFKPPPRVPDQVQPAAGSGLVVWVSHVAFIAPLVAYVGIAGVPSWATMEVGQNGGRALNAMLVFLAVATWLHHGGRLAAHMRSPSAYASEGFTALGPDAANLMPWDAIIDVRSLSEWNAGHHPRAMHVPNDSDLARLSLPRGAKILVYCKSGRRARPKAEALRAAGFAAAFHLVGSWRQLAN